MKKIIEWHFLSRGVLSYFSYKSHLKSISLFILFAFMNLVVGCSYYKVSTVAPTYDQSAPKIEELKNKQKFFIMHQGDNVWGLNNISISEDKTELSGNIYKLPENHKHYLYTKPDHIKRFKSKDKNVLQEVHVYISEYAEGANTNIIIPLTSIEKIELYDRAQGATIASWVFSSLGILTAVYVVLVIIVLLTKSSCPFIYTFDGEHFVFSGEIFSGATQPGLERHDYMRLPGLKAAEGNYLVNVTNEIKEIQHINLMELKVIDHPTHTQVLIDKYGQPQTFAELQMPFTATTFGGKNILPLITAKDSLSYYCDASAIDKTAIDGMVLQFANPGNAEAAKLVLRAKNSFWLDHLFSEFHALFGSAYSRFNKTQASASFEQQRAWMLNQSLPLAVYLEKNGEWVMQDCFEIAGPMAMKDDVLALDLKGLKSETLNIKLETGFLFWEIDYAALDFTSNMPLEVITVPVLKALTEKGKEISKALSSDDAKYYIQPEVGNQATLTFPVPQFTDESRTVILHSKGFYKILRDQKGLPDRATLETFCEPGRMPKFSQQMYERMTTTANR